MQPVPFVDLGRQHATLRAELDRAVNAVVERGEFILGPAVARFERQFADYCGTRHAVGVGSGGSALQLALEALGVGSGDEVITVANTFIATACAISRTGATPVLVDCLDSTLGLDTGAVAGAVTPRTRAIVPVHLFGRLAEMEAIAQIATRHDLPIVEDAAQAHGAARGGRRAGAFGQLAGFSFYPAKNLGAWGDAGAVTTDDDALAARVRLLRDYGQRAKYEHEIPGENSRLDTLQAAILGVKLMRLDAWNDARRRAAARYRAGLAGTRVVLPAEPDVAEAHVHHLFVVRIADRDRVRAELSRQGIQTGIHYPVPVHLHPAYRSLGRGVGSYPIAERAAQQLLSLPMFAEITPEEIDRVCEVLKALVG